ncbi:MAG: hypothetical protein WCD75_14420 [Rhodoplanes sp.]
MQSSEAAFEHTQRGATVDLAEALIAPVLGFVCSNGDLRRRVGLKGASRRADGWPGWYFWFAGVPGAHELIFVPPVDRDDAVPSVEFVIRYFPHPDESAFASFAPVEQAVRRSTLFDATGTPAVDGFEAIEPSLFHVAMLAIRPSSGLIDLEFSAQDCWLEIEASGEKAAPRRAVRGFELGAPALDFIVAACAFCGRRPPSAVEILYEPGVKWRIENGLATAETSDDIALLTVHVRSLARFGVGPDDVSNADEFPVLQSQRQRCVFRHSGTYMPPSFPGLDLATWWRAATWRFIPSGMFCGCQAEDLSVAGRDEVDACVAAGGRRRTSP